MAKKRKSREEKLKADTRHFHYHFEAPTVTKAQPSSPNHDIPIQANTVIYPYLKHDISKTILLTASILVLQILTFFILKIHTFPFLGIKY